MRRLTDQELQTMLDQLNEPDLRKWMVYAKQNIQLLVMEVQRMGLILDQIEELCSKVVNRTCSSA
jgi:hypothetical protein